VLHDAHETGQRFECLGDGRYRLTVPAHGIQFDVDRLRRDRDELQGELAVYCGILGARAIDGCLQVGKFNLSAPRARQEWAKGLIERLQTPRLNWHGWLEELCQRVLAAERTGQPAKLLHTFNRPDPADVWAIEGITLLKQHPMMLFGDGGTGKSLLSLFLVGQLARRGVNVLYADWELSGEDHRDRLERLFGADMPCVFYARCDRPMVSEADRLRRLVQQHQIGYLVCDSVAFACDGPPESAESAGSYFRAVRQIGVGSLHLAHVTKNREGDKGSEQKPFGSVFWHNSARATWFAKLAETSTTGDAITVGLYNRKANLGPMRPALAFQIAFGSTRTEIDRVNVADVDDLAASLPYWQRMKRAIEASGPMKPIELAEELGATDENRERTAETIARTARRLKGVFTRITGQDGVQRIALVSRRAA
jgi:hypothetical protein